MPIGPTELLLILGVIVLFLGASRIPQIGDALGRSLVNFKRAINGTDEVDVSPNQEVGPGDDKQS